MGVGALARGYSQLVSISGAICGKTGKTWVLPWFWKIEGSGGSGSALRAVRTGGAPENDRNSKILKQPKFSSKKALEKQLKENKNF